MRQKCFHHTFVRYFYIDTSQKTPHLKPFLDILEVFWNEVFPLPGFNGPIQVLRNSRCNGNAASVSLIGSRSTLKYLTTHQGRFWWISCVMASQRCTFGVHFLSHESPLCFNIFYAPGFIMTIITSAQGGRDKHPECTSRLHIFNWTSRKPAISLNITLALN